MSQGQLIETSRIVSLCPPPLLKQNPNFEQNWGLPIGEYTFMQIVLGTPNPEMIYFSVLLKNHPVSMFLSPPEVSDRDLQ